MKRYILILSIAFSALVSCTKEPQWEPMLRESKQEPEAYKSGVLLVKFTPEVVAVLEEQGECFAGALTRSGAPALDEILALLGDCRLERVFPLNVATEAKTREAGLHQWYVVRFDEKYEVAQVAARMRQLGEVQQVDLNRTVKRAYNGKATPLEVQNLPKTTRAEAAPMNDPLFSMQWNLENRGDMFREGEVVKSVKDADVQCVEAWSKTTGSPEVIVAVLDEGIFVDHPDLKANMWVNPQEVNGSHEDNDGNGYAGDVYGYNFVHETGKITWNDAWDSGHGSHVAGVIAAVNNNGEGISSIAGGDGRANTGVRVMACQIFSGNMSTGLLNVVRAMKYAADNGAVVLQCSWGYVSGSANIYDWGEAGFATQEQWEMGSPLEKAALEYFVHYAGSPTGPIDGGIAVFAGGNESAPAAGFPGAADFCVSVAATAADFTPAVYTNYGPGTTISAPGGDQDYYFEYVDETHNYGEIGCILSTLPYNVSKSGYGYMEGTSMACPHVSAVVALAISHAAEQRRHYKADELRDLLHATTVDIDPYMTGKKTYCRYVADVGPIRPMQMILGDYAGKMGTGQVNTTALLAAMDGAGVEMRFPNLTIAVEGQVAVSPARYFVEGESLTYTVSIADTTIAACESQEHLLLFKGLKSGSTTATISASNGEVHTFAIVVRQTDGGLGWL